MPTGTRASAELAGMSRRLATVPRTFKLQAAAALRGAVQVKVIPALRQSAMENLPQSGGLNQWVADQPVQVRTRLVGRNVYVQVRQPRIDARQLNQGYVRHPVFGNRDAWVTQQVSGATDWWTDPLEHARPELEVALIAVMREMQALITRYKWGL